MAKKDKWENRVKIIGLGIVILIIASMILTRMDLFPAKGSAIGYIYYQEKAGLFQLDRVCWKDTPYIPNCEIFNPNGVQYVPGRYRIDYECKQFAWSWETPSVCTITNATRLGD